ncbi:MAG: hypothetical protein IKE04_02805 [Oscillospiraceae bacterium]|nr:hypothetical protein [Oscillospiraceae bacterium]
MAIKSSDQISIVDLTDGYSVILTNDSYTFPGGISAAIAGSTNTTVIAMCGASQVAASVDLAAITKPSGVTVTKDSNATQPTLTIAVDTSVTAGGTVDIPVSLDNGNITIHKLFTFAIAFTSATGAPGTNGTSAAWYTGTKITGTSTTATVFSGSGITAAKVGDMYLNTSTSNVYRCTVAGAASAAKWVYAGNIKGQTGEAGDSVQWYTGTKITGTSTTATAFSGSGISAAVVGDMYLNTDTGNTYRCTVGGAASAAKWVYVSNIKGATGDTGPAGADAITMSITSSGGTIFKNTAVSTTLTAHVYKAGQEVTGDDLTALGTIRWYKDGSTTPLSTTGPTLTISAGDVTNKATYIAQLETT